ncbi:MAG TPA: hypothetical protein VF752_11885 [Thermoleophilaceae bacterium]
MSTKAYTFLGRVVWHSAMVFGKWKFQQNRAKIRAAGVVALVLLGGVAAAKASSSGD